MKNTKDWEIVLVDYYGTTITFRNQKQNEWADEPLVEVLGTILKNFALNYKIIFWNEQDMLSPLLLSQIDKQILNLKHCLEKEGGGTEPGFNKMAVSILGLERAGSLTTVITHSLTLII